MKKQIHKWPQNVLDKLDLVFVDAPFPCNGKSAVEGIFDPPYYEWFQFNEVIFFFKILFFHNLARHVRNILVSSIVCLSLLTCFCGTTTTTGIYGVHKL